MAAAPDNIIINPVHLGTYTRIGAILLSVSQSVAYFLLAEYSKTRENSVRYLSGSAVLAQEVLKLGLSLLFVFVWEAFGSVDAFWEALRDAFGKHRQETLALAVPGFFYTVQTTLVYQSVALIGGPTTQVLLQVRVLTTALFATLLMGQRFSLAQWGSLSVLAIGAALVQLDAMGSGSSEGVTGGAVVPDEIEVNDDFVMAEARAQESVSRILVEAVEENVSIWGFGAVALAAVLSGFCGVYLEQALKKKGSGLWTRNVVLSLYGILFSVVGLFIEPASRKAVIRGGVLRGFDSVVWGVVALGSIGGLVISILLKYTDNIVKNFAGAGAVVAAVAVEIVYRQELPTFRFGLGALLVAASMMLYRMAKGVRPEHQGKEDDQQPDATAKPPPATSASTPSQSQPNDTQPDDTDIESPPPRRSMADPLEDQSRRRVPPSSNTSNPYNVI